MATRARTPSLDAYNSVAPGSSSLADKGHGANSTEYAPTAGNAVETSPLAQSFARPTSTFSNRYEDFDDHDRGYTPQQLEGAGLHRTASMNSNKGVPSRKNTLTKQKSLSRKTSLKRSGSRKSLHAGSIKGVGADERVRGEEYNSVFYTPVPTTGVPTDVLANRFQAWRKILKDLITYFREIQDSYGTRSKGLMKVSNVINNMGTPSLFSSEGGLGDANRILRDYHKQAITEANKARDVENDVIAQLSGLRADLGQKIKEIKSLSGDFKNSVEKEKDHTRKAVATLQEALGVVDSNPTALVGKEDPYIVRLNVDRQVERQVDEENYLHRAYLNLEGSGRELESIVIGEIQKAYNAFAGILKREADDSYTAIEQLRSGPVSMPKDYEWNQFIEHDPHFVNPNTPLRKVDDIEYPGKSHPAAAEVRAGMLERKSKYLKSYTPGWYVLSPTHLHEFKSADRIYTQPPVMSLLLSDQKLGSRSQPGSSSHKFMIKGRQTGAMHRGHSWIFRAESYETMLAWYDDIQALTEKTGEERNAFVRKHARSFSGNSKTGSDSGLEEDEADQVPYSANTSLSNHKVVHEPPAQTQRPQPGRFPSELSNNQSLNRHLQPPLSPSSGSSLAEQDLTTAAGGLQGDNTHYNDYNDAAMREIAQPTPIHPNVPSFQHQERDQLNDLPVRHAQVPVSQMQSQQSGTQPDISRHDSNYQSWMAPATGGVAIGAGAVAAEEHWRNKRKQAEEQLVQADSADATQVLDHKPEISSQYNSFAETTTASVIPEPHHALTATEGITPTAVTKEIPPSIASQIETLPPTATAVPPVPEVYVPSGARSKIPESKTGVPEAKSSVIPGVSRQNTDNSISNLHIPGEYPKGVAS